MTGHSRLWHAAHDPKRDLVVHEVARGFGHALLGAVGSYVFQALRVPASLWEHGFEWFPIHSVPHVMTFDLEHGAEAERYAYNNSMFARVAREKRLVRGAYAGLHDAFVPVMAQGRVAATLVVGPFAIERPTAHEILARWRALTGRQGHPADPEFAWYLAESLSVLTLEGKHAAEFERLLTCLALLLAGEGDAGALANEVTTLRASVERARFAERMWEAVESIVDVRTSLARYTTAHSSGQKALGLSEPADAVLVGLATDPKRDDPVDEAVRRDALQRRVVELARSTKNVLAGRVWDAGVVLVAAVGGSAERKRRKLSELSEQAARFARKELDLELRFGASFLVQPGPLSHAFRAALGAAQAAAQENSSPGSAKLLFAEKDAPLRSLRDLRKELAAAAGEDPLALAVRFDRYLDAVATETGYRIERAQGHLEAGFERFAEPLLASGALDSRSYATLVESLDRAAAEARSFRDLSAAYRRAAEDVSEALRAPVAARRDRSLRAAMDYMSRHFTERLRLPAVARVSGLTASHFSKLFIRQEGMPFEHYLRQLRLERAKHLLVTTQLSAKQIAEACGFGTVYYFHRVFREALGTTPMEYRKAPRRADPTNKKAKKSRKKALPSRAKKTA